MIENEAITAEQQIPLFPDNLKALIEKTVTDSDKKFKDRSPNGIEEKQMLEPFATEVVAILKELKDPDDQIIALEYIKKVGIEKNNTNPKDFSARLLLSLLSIAAIAVDPLHTGKE